jgi:hypothetical protein
MVERTAVTHERYAGLHPHAFAGFGRDADVDAALDDAKAAAYDQFGHSRDVASVAGADPTAVTVATDVPVTLELATVTALQRIAAGDCLPGVVYALPVCADGAYRARKVTVPVDDVNADLGVDEPGTVPVLPEPLRGYVAGLLDTAGKGLADGEVIESVLVRTLRRVYRPVVTKVGSKEADGTKIGSQSRFEARVRQTGALVGSGRTEGEARRVAVEAVKAGAVDGLHQYDIDVDKVVRRDGWRPQTSVARALVTQKASLNVRVVVPKDPAKLKATGFLFFGVAGEPTAQAPSGQETPEAA